MSGVAAAALMDLGHSPDQGEMLYLLLRLPGAAVHALEQKEYGWRRFPFFTHALELENDPGEKLSMGNEETTIKRKIQSIYLRTKVAGGPRWGPSFPKNKTTNTKKKKKPRKNNTHGCN